jgi:TPR repeat protein
VAHFKIKLVLTIGPSVFARAMLRNLELAIAAISAALFISSAAIAETQPPSAAAQTAYKLGIDALSKKDFPAALRQLTIACDGAVAGGCFHLAGIYLIGKGRPKDSVLAAKFHARSCELGDDDGCNNVGLQYQMGQGVPQSYEQAIVYFKRALVINPKHPNAGTNLRETEQALALRKDLAKAGMQTPNQAASAAIAARSRKDYAAALRLYTIACNGAAADGCFGLGNAYELGEGVPIDKVRAARFYDNACTLRDAYGCTNLGAMYHDGDGIVQSFDRAIASYRRALAIDPQNEVAVDSIALSEQKQAQARTRPAAASPAAQKAYEAGIAAYGANDFASALRQFGAACDARLASGCANLGVLVSGGKGVAPDKARAAQFFSTACTGGNANGCYNLGLFYDDGTGVPRNLTTAAAYYIKACDAGGVNGCYNAGVAYDRGDGVAQSTDRALGFYRRALVIDPKFVAADKAIASAERRRAARQ